MLHPPKKRKRSFAIEEVKFDDDARADYLSGFHKRKLQRVKHAQEQAASQKKAERIEARKRLRETRKADLEKHVDTVNKLLKDAHSVGRGDSDGTDGTDGEDSAEDETFSKITSKIVDHKDEYVDEDKFTTVVVENVQVTKEGLEKQADGSGSSMNGGKIYNKMEQTARSLKKPNRPAKKKFRYENKKDRKTTRHKERAGSRAQAKARKQ